MGGFIINPAKIRWQNMAPGGGRDLMRKYCVISPED